MTSSAPRSSGDAFVRELARALPSSAVSTDPTVLGAHRRDNAPFVESGMPLVLVRPTSTAVVSEVLRLASAHRIPVVARGAGSGLAGGANAVDGCAMLSLSGMDRILEVDRADLLAVVEPGVVTASLDAAAEEVGLSYPPDPASAEFSTIGGNVATNAGGLCCVKYGVTGDSVLGLEVVLADGSVIETGRRTLKGVAGLDLTSLFVGSEGTLGIVTRATLRLRPRTDPPATTLAFFADMKATGVAISEIVANAVPSVLEVMDRTTVGAVEGATSMGLDLDAAALLIGRSDVGGDRAERDAELFARACADAGATAVHRSTDPAESEMLMRARRMAFPSLERIGTALLDDVAVPIGRIPDLLAAIEATADRRSVTVGTFGHAGDGNMHPTIVFDGRDPAEASAARDAFEDIVRAALELDGTITGEHGVGLLKRPYLRRELGEGAIGVQTAIKRTLDPLGLLNPGKVFPGPG